MSNKALILVTSHEKLGDTGNDTGFYWEELAAPYWAFRDAGLDVEFASVKGGKPPADPKSAAADRKTEAVDQFLADDASMKALENSKKASEVDPGTYELVFLPGGHGTMWDFAQTDAVGKVVAEAYESGAVVGAVCHGPSGLLNAQLSSGDPLVKDKRVNSFTDSEEEAVGLTGVVPYLLETELRNKGARFEKGENFKPYAVRDERLVTGQNPSSSEKVAELLIEAFRDEKILAA
jgi:putative intracellular protease/amidase